MPKRPRIKPNTDNPCEGCGHPEIAHKRVADKRVGACREHDCGCEAYLPKKKLL